MALILFLEETAHLDDMSKNVTMTCQKTNFSFQEKVFCFMQQNFWFSLNFSIQVVAIHLSDFQIFIVFFFFDMSSWHISRFFDGLQRQDFESTKYV